MNSTVYKYLTKKYIEIDLLDKNGDKVIKNKSLWNPFIYPDDGYIPQCRVCKNVYDEYTKQNEIGPKIKELLWPHLKCGCLWKDYFEDKIKQTNPDIKFIER